jgi:hypothetical protein
MKNPNEREGCPILEYTFSILLFPVTDADFLNAIRHIKPSKSFGLHDIPGFDIEG